jgi:site-specific DNA-methyltransferase (adenine-specific)
MTALTLHQGNAMELLNALPEGSVDAVIVDPPYGKTKLPWDRPLPWASLWPELHRIAKPTSNLLIFSQQPFTSELITSNRAAFRYELIWHKTRAMGFLDARCRPLRAHENILLFCQRWRGSKNQMQATYCPQMMPGDPYHKLRVNDRRGNRAAHYGSCSDPFQPTINATGERFPHSVITVPSRNEHGHPTAKPVELLRWLVRTYTRPGEVILDCCMGYGSTGVAALAEGRRFIGMEKDPAIFAQAEARLKGL